MTREAYDTDYQSKYIYKLKINDKIYDNIVYYDCDYDDNNSILQMNRCEVREIKGQVVYYLDHISRIFVYLKPGDIVNPEESKYINFILHDNNWCAANEEIIKIHEAKMAASHNKINTFFLHFLLFYLFFIHYFLYFINLLNHFYIINLDQFIVIN